MCSAHSQRYAGWGASLGLDCLIRFTNALALPRGAFKYHRLASEADTLQNVGYRQRELGTCQDLRLGSSKLQAVLIFGYQKRARVYNLDSSFLTQAARFPVGGKQAACFWPVAESINYYGCNEKVRVTELKGPGMRLPLASTSSSFTVFSPIGRPSIM